MVTVIRELPWVGDGVSATEKNALQELLWTSSHQIDIAWDLLRMPWFVDGPVTLEISAMERLRWTTMTSADLGQKLSDKSWIHDGITADEVTVIQYLNWIARPNDDEMQEQTVEAAIKILDMPFLNSVESRDTLAMRSLENLEYASTADFLNIMSHAKLDDGITDQETKIVALLGGTYSKQPDAVDFLLRGVGVFVEERTIELPHTGETGLAIVRIRDQKTPAMDYLENSVRAIDEFMGVPFHTNYIILYFDDTTTYALGGNYFGTHMAMSLLYDVEHGQLWDRTPFVIAHEVAHYFWHSGNAEQAWLNEGYAEILASVAEHERTGAEIGTTNRPCAAAKTLSELESLEAKVKTNEFRCHYSLGEQLMLGLYDGLGPDTFREGARALYLMTLGDGPAAPCEGEKVGICHLRAAFRSVVSAEEAATAEEIISQWYGTAP